MGRMTFSLFAAVALVALASSCGDSPGSGGIADEDYFPFAIGNNWSYDRYGTIDTLGVTFTLSGQALRGVVGIAYEEGYSLIQVNSVAADTLFAEGLDTIPVPQGGVAFFRMDSEGVWAYTDSVMSDSVQIARFPLQAGDTWLFSTDPEATAEVVSMTETVTVPEGTFDDVLHISVLQQDTLLSMVQDMYFAPGVGNILNETTVSAGTIVVASITEELLDAFLF